jgi:hypothetical protein
LHYAAGNGLPEMKKKIISARISSIGKQLALDDISNSKIIEGKTIPKPDIFSNSFLKDTAVPSGIVNSGMAANSDFGCRHHR